MGKQRIRLSLALMVIALAVAAPAFGIDKAKAALTMAGQAAKAYERGDYARAAELYLQAYDTDHNPAYIYGVARAEHVGGQFDKALQHYDQFAASEGADAERAAKARAYAAAIRAGKAEAKVQEADNAARTGETKLAAQLYLDAWRQAPERVELLFKAAVAEQMAGDLASAEKHFQAYLLKAPAGSGDSNTAKARLEAIQRQLHPGTPAGPGSATLKPAAVVAAAPTETHGHGAAYALLAGGGAALVGGAVLYALTRSDINEFDKTNQKDASGKVTGTYYDDAAAKAGSINTRVGMAAAFGGVGLLAAGAGVWLLVRAPDQVTLVPGTSGAVLAWRF